MENGTGNPSENEKNIPKNEPEIIPSASETQKKRKNPVLVFFKSILAIVIALLVIFAAILCYCAFDKKSSLSAVPRNYSLYVRTDSAFDTVNPLFDLQAADSLFSNPEFSSIRKIFIDFRSSALRENPFFNFAASRPLDFAFYGNGTKIGEDSHFVTVLNLGLFSFLSRSAQFLYPKLDFSSSDNEIFQNLSYEKNEQASYFVYKTQDFNVYLKSVKNLLVASDSLEHLLVSSFVENDVSYTDEQKRLFTDAKRGELKIVADARSFLHFVTEGNEILSSMTSLVSADSLSVISFNVSDSDISLKARIPVSSDEEDARSLSPILSKKSTVPAILTRFSDITQYYTVLNAGTFEDIKNAVLPFAPNVKNPDDFWKNCDGWSQSLLGMTIDELLFSWLGNEGAVFGIENQNDPIFVLQIRDEKKRQEVFNKLTSSILIKDDNSLILGGVRLPRLELPSFLNWLLGIFGVNLPSPYFMVLDGNIYFSESAECLSNVYNAAHDRKSLVKNKNYLAVSQGLKNEAALSLFYNLERSVPFFLRSNQSVSQFLKFYTMGRFDVSFEKEILEINLHALAEKNPNQSAVPGFPLTISGKVSADNLQVESGKNPKHIFWVEDEKDLKALELSSMQILSKSASDKIQIVAAENPKNDGVLWSVTAHGMVSLLSSKLENVGNFPIILGENVSVRPAAVGENLVVISENESVFIVKPDSSFVTIEISGLSAKSAPAKSSDGKSFAIYSKGFFGKIYYFTDDKCVNLENPFEIPGIALGSPAILKNGSKNYVAIITQAGEMNVWRLDSKDSAQVDGFPMRLGGVFMKNVASDDKYFYAMTNEALLYRISLKGEILSVQIPQASAREGYLSVRDAEKNGKKNVFACADANIIWGFNENLELLPLYPLSGWGKPVFADVNGDKNAECIATTIDKKLVAWKTK